MAGFTQRQRRFIEAFRGDATAAARAAGYAPATASVMGSRLLRLVKVQEAIQAREAETLRPLIADRDERLAFWSGVMRGVDRGEGGAPRLADRLKASELLAKASGDFLPQTETPGPVRLTVKLPEGWGMDAQDMGGCAPE